MAYTKLRDLIQLAQDLQATSIGLTYEEMIEKCKTTYLIGLIDRRQGIELYIIFRELLNRRRHTPIKLENNVITILPSSEYLDKS